MQKKGLIFFMQNIWFVSSDFVVKCDLDMFLRDSP